MFNFSEEELIELSRYPKQALQHANKEMTKLLHQGKSLSSPFKFCVAVCDRWVADENKKTPQTGRSEASVGKPRPSTFRQYVEGGKWIVGAKVLNGPSGYQTTITHVETDYEFALNYEKAIHKRTLEDPELAARCARFDRNPIWAKLNDFDKDDIWNKAHTKDCTCRKNEHAGLIMPDIAQKMVERPEQQIIPFEEQYNNFDDMSVWEEV